MTEEEWLTTTDNPRDMLEHLEQRVSHRKWRLFLCGCSRGVWHILTDHVGRRTTEAAEQYADGLITGDELSRVQQEENVRLHATDRKSPLWHAVAGALGATYLDTKEEFDCAYWATDEFVQSVSDEDAEHARQCELLRDIFGNPFRPVTFSAEWRTDTAVSLARTMYESREFSAMPILADALQDAGCDDPDILDHCRDAKQIHVRGCWVVDLVLGKS